MTNKRSETTKKAIEDQFFQLLKTKNINDIKVTEITSALDMHRTTFYKYYDSVYDLAESIEARIFTVDHHTTPGNIAAKNLKHVRDTGSSEKLSILLANEGHEPSFDARLRRIREGNLRTVIDKMNLDYRTEELPYYTIFIQKGLPGLIEWSLSPDNPLTSDESSYLVDTLLVRTPQSIHDILKEIHCREN